MLFYEPGKIEIESFPLIQKAKPEPVVQTPEPEKNVVGDDIPMIPDEFYQVQAADDELAKSIWEINQDIVLPDSDTTDDTATQTVTEDQMPIAEIEQMQVENVAQQIIDEITEMLGGNASALYLCTDGVAELMLYNAEETCATLDTSNEFVKKLQAGNAVSVSSDVLSSGIFEDGIVSEELSNCVSFLAVPLEMMGMLLGVLFLGFEIEIGEEFDQVKDMLVPYMTKLKEALG